MPDRVWPVDIRKITGDCNNFVFIGDAGKSEVALNLTLWLRAGGGRECHFFNLE